MSTNWDKYYLGLAKMVGDNSKCLSRKIGSVLVKDNSIIATGYNGPAKGCLHCNQRPWEFYYSLDCNTPNNKKHTGYPTKCPRQELGYKSGEGLHLCSSVHSERNCLLQCARLGISTRGSTIYAYCPIPCKDCVIELINAGVSKVVCLPGLYDKYSIELIKDSDIILTTVEELV
jgi:dCMP deaminase